MAHGRPTYRIRPGAMRDRRELGGMTLRGLSAALKQHGCPVSDSQLSKIERGVSTPRPVLLKAIADVLGVDTRQLVTR